MAKLFNQKPSDIALLDDGIGPFGQFYFNRGIATFGKAVASRMSQAGHSSNETLARTQRDREWERLMGGDLSTSTTGFQDPSPDSVSPYGRFIGSPDSDDDIILEDGQW